MEALLNAQVHFADDLFIACSLSALNFHYNSLVAEAGKFYFMSERLIIRKQKLEEELGQGAAEVKQRRERILAPASQVDSFRTWNI